MRRRGLSTFFFLGLAVTTAVPLVTAGVFEVQRVGSASRDNADRALRASADAMARETRTTIEGNIRVLEMLAGELEAVDDWKQDLGARLHAMRARYGGFHFIYAATADGISFAADGVATPPGQGPVGVDYSDRAYFKALIATQETVTSPVEMGRVTHLPGIHAATPVFGPDRKLRGYLLGSLDLNEITETADNIRAGHPSQRIIVFDREGNMVAQSSGNDPMQRPYEAVALYQIPIQGTVVRTGDDDAAQPSHAAITSVDGILEWGVVAVQANTDIDGLANAARRRVLLVALLTVLLGLVVSAGMAAWLGRPIRQLALVAEAAGDGTLLEPPRPRPGEPREVAILLSELSAMMNRMRTNTAELEETVKQRTAMLTASNAELEHRLRELHETQTRLGLADRMASVGTLAAGVGHEINNPLAYVLGNLQYVIERLDEHLKAKPEDVALADPLQALKEAEEGAQRVKAIVRDLRLFARAGEQDTVGPVDVRGVLEAAISMSFNEIRHRARLEKSYQHTRPVLASEGRLSQVFLNLLVNAAQAIREGAAEANLIRVATRDDGDDVVVEISDTGGGIASEHLAKIFDPFFTTKAVGEGTGLGLAITQRIVSDLRGRISIDTTVGKGTMFTIALPATQVAATEAAASASPQPNARRRVLVVDDEPGVIKALQRILSDSHDVEGTTDATEALKQLSHGKSFDVIFCDVMMPHVNGMEFLERLKGARPDHVKRVIFMTGGAFSTEARDFVSRTTHQVIDKPFSSDVIKAAAARAF